VTTPYHIKVSPAARRQILALTPKHRKVIIRLVEALSVNPRPPGSRKVNGMRGLYSESANHSRVIYKIEDQEVLVLVVK